MTEPRFEHDVAKLVLAYVVVPFGLLIVMLLTKLALWVIG